MAAASPLDSPALSPAEWKALNKVVHAPDYQKGVARRLAETLAEAIRPENVVPFDLDTRRLIIFSDLHKGARNGADDFRTCERPYNAALAYYFTLGYTLVELGDVEELWEEHPGAVMKAYAHTLELSARFHEADRYFRLWGNHDDAWANPDAVKAHLGPFYRKALPVREGLCFSLKTGGETLGTLFLTHGHQGDPSSDQNSAVSRWAVRHLWRFVQRTFKVSLNTPARDWKLRARHNVALYRWAEQQRGGAHGPLVLVAGHTHQPVFGSQTHPEQIARDLAAATAPEEQARLSAALEWATVKDEGITGPDALGVTPMAYPCYFNSGCCAFLDGDITGLEVADGQIRLVRWPDDHGTPRPCTLDAMPLRAAFA